jgi:hypothetical protein
VLINIYATTGRGNGKSVGIGQNDFRPRLSGVFRQVECIGSYQVKLPAVCAGSLMAGNLQWYIQNKRQLNFYKNHSCFLTKLDQQSFL